MDDVIIARALHVLCVIHWIGGVAFITLVALPLAIARAGGDGLALFEAIEKRFSFQVRFSIPLAGVSGLWMTYRGDLWSRFADAHFWWMNAMAGLWLAFMLIVFAIEPLFHERLERLATANPVETLGRIARVHIVLLALAVLTAFGAVAGSQGMDLF